VFEEEVEIELAADEADIEDVPALLQLPPSDQFHQYI
jgi:hypothetical protein